MDIWNGACHNHELRRPLLKLVVLRGLLERRMGGENRLCEVISKITRIPNEADVGIHIDGL